MALLSMNETTTFRWSFEEDVSNYRASEIPAIGVWRQKLSDYGDEKGIELLAESGLKVSHLLWAGGFTGSEGRSFRGSVEDAQEALELAQAMKAGSLVVYSGARAGHTYNHARRLLKDALKELVPIAAQRGVSLAVEPMHPGCATEFTFLTSIDDTLELLDTIGSPWMKMVFDAYHLGQEPDVLERIADVAPHVALVQLGDARQPPEGEQNRCRLGDGVVPLAEIVAAFRQAGFDGFFDVELLGEELEIVDYHELLEHAKQVFSELIGSEG